MEGSVKTVFFVDGYGVQEGIPSEFLGVPFVIDEDGNPDSFINEYMLARRNGDWAALDGAEGAVAELEGRKVLRADLGYLRNRAYQLGVLRRWLRGEGLTYATVSEKQLGQFAEDLEEGVITEFEGGLQPSTVNQYLTSAIDFLRYGALVRWREPLKLKTARARAGKRWRSRPLIMRRVNPQELPVWYTEDQIAAFIGEFDTAAAKLAARLMYGTGLRISEALSLTVGQFPPKDAFARDPAKRRMRVVGKFKKARWVPITPEVLATVHRFIDFDRKLYALQLRSPTDLLLIGPESEGRTAPMKARAVQKAFVRAREAAGFSALSPHLLRHHFAAHFLIRAWRAKVAVPGASVPTADISLATSLLSVELITLKEALGHQSLETTMKYLHAVAFLSGSHISDAYAEELNPEYSE